MDAAKLQEQTWGLRRQLHVGLQQSREGEFFVTKARLAIYAAVCVPLMAFGGPVAFAATAHNLETGAHTKNANDTASDARMKQMHMKKKHKKMM